MANFVVDKNFNFMELPLSISRQGAFPVDRLSVWYTEAEAQAYAASDPRAYAGQILSIVTLDEVNGDNGATYEAASVKLAAIGNDHNLITIATASGDASSVAYADVAGKLKNAVTINVTGDEITGSVTFDGSKTPVEMELALSASLEARIAALETAVSTTLPDAIATAKSEAISSAQTYTNTEVKKVADRVTTAEGEIDTLQSDVTTINETTLPALKTELKSYADTAESDAVAAAKTYTNGEVKKVADRATALETAVTTINETTLPALKTELKSYADTAESDAVAAAKTYTDTEVKKVADRATDLETAVDTINDTTLPALKTELQTYADTAESDAVAAAKTYTNGEVKKVADRVTTAEGEIDDLQTAVTTTLPEAIATAKSEAVSTAKTYTNTEVKKVADRATALETTVAELTGNGENSIDSKIAAAESNAVATAKSYTDTEVKKVADRVTTAEGEIDDLQTAVTTINETTLPALKTELKSYADTAESDAVAAAKTYTNGEVKKVADRAAALETAVNTTLPEAIATAKSEAISSAKTYTDTEVKKVADRVTTAEGEIDDLQAAVTTINETTLPALKTELQTYADTAESDAVAAAKTYTNGEVKKVADRVTTAEGEIDDLQTEVTTIKETTLPALKTELKSYADTAESDAVAAAKTYTDTEVKKVADRVTTAEGEIDDLQTAVTTTLPDAIATAKSEAISAAQTYTNTEVKKVADRATTLETAVNTTLPNAIATAKSEAISTAKTYTDNAVADLLADQARHNYTLTYDAANTRWQGAGDYATIMEAAEYVYVYVNGMRYDKTSFTFSTDGNHYITACSLFPVTGSGISADDYDIVVEAAKKA